MRGRLAAGVLILTVLAGVLTAPPASAVPNQPAQPATGYGGTAGYLPGNGSVGSIDDVDTILNPGGDSDGTRVWVFKPPALRNGTSAPVVVYLHGFALLAPDIYADHILHLVRQGNIVIYPQINQGGLGLLSDNSQSAMLDRAIASTNTALAWLGAAAGPRHLFGHSLGGLLGATWADRGGPAVQSLVLANPSTAAPPVGSGLPWQTMAPATTARTIILTGEDDTIAAPSQSDGLFNAMPAAFSRIVYEAKSDTYGNPSSQDITADHSGPAQDYGFLETFPFSLFLDSFGGPAKLDALDSRYYWAALDASIDGQMTVPFQMGQWSDGTAVRPPVIRLQDVPTAPSAPSLTATPGNTQVALSWTAPSDGGTPITAYRIYRDGTLIHTTASAATLAYTDTGRSNGTPYSYEVAAVNAVGTGPRSPAATATPAFAPPTTPTFIDVGLGHVFFTEIEWLASEGIAGGFTDGTFRPGLAVTRQAMAAFLQRFAGATGAPAPGSSTFSDVPTTHPFFDEIEWAAAEGLITGYPDGTFRPSAAVARQAMAAFLFRLEQPTFTAPGTPSFSDVGLGHPFFTEIEWLASTGITTGFPGDVFRPGQAVTRQSTAAFLFRLSTLS